MSKLGDEVRASYERQQAGLGDVGDARHRLIRNALTAPTAESHRVQWAAGIAAVLIAAIVITTFALVHGNSRQQPTPAASPKANASPTPLQNQINVPDTTPLVIYQDPAKADQLDGVTWDGKSFGQLREQLPAGVGNWQNTMFATSDSITDRSGKTLMTGTFGAKFFAGTWADDGRHFCQMVPFDNPSGSTGLPTTLQVVTVGQGIRSVARVGTLYNQTVVKVAACSVAADRAVVVQSGGQGVGTAAVWSVELSTGRIVWTHSYDVASSSVTSVVSSGDGMYVAENLTQGKPAGSTVYGPDGTAITQLFWWVEAFSWDDNLAVMDDGGYGYAPVHLMIWRDGTQVWSGPADMAVLRSAAEPKGTEIAMWLAPSNQFRFQTFTPDLYLLTSKGSVIFHVAWPAPALP